MNFFFKPSGIALIGASADPLKGGYSILKNVRTGYRGPIYPVNPRYPSIEGLTCYASVLQVPEPVDMAIVFVPAAQAVKAVEECARRSIKGVMIQSAGFAETGEAGRKLQEDLLRIKDKSGIRIWGPNCMGLVDAVHRHVFSFVLPVIWDLGLKAGEVSLIVQSGMLSAGFLIDTVTHGTMGISKACSIGNKADVNECDILEYLIEDPHTSVIGGYLESVTDGPRFLNACRTTDKPIVILKGGKSAKGAEAAMSHTASLAGNGALVSDALRQVGVTEADDFKQMLDLCRTLALERRFRPHGRDGRVAVITYSGGAGIVSADFMDRMGLVPARLSETTIGSLEEIYPEWMPPANPVDLWPAIEKNGPDTAYEKAFEAVLSDPGVDAVLFHVFIGGKVRQMDVAPLAGIAEKYRKPVFTWLLGSRSEAHEFQLHAQALGFPVFRELFRAVECMAAFFKQKKLSRGPESALSESRWEIAPDLADVLASREKILDEHISKKILSQFGVPTVKERIVTSEQAAVSAGQDFGYPAVLKGLIPGVVHKTERNLVRLSLQTPEDIRTAFRNLKEVTDGRGDILVQQQIKGEPELIIGMLRDPQFGPCVMCGLGGILTEILNDKVFAVAPIDHQEGLALIERLKTQRILNGYRKVPAVNRDILADILVGIGALGTRYPSIQEIDINPLMVKDGVPTAVDASIILKAGTS